MKSRCISVLLVSIMLITLIHFSGNTTAILTQSELADWTFLIFFSADNNLDSDAIDDLNELEMVGSTAEVQVLVLIDTRNQPAYLYHVVQDDDPDVISSTILTDTGIASEPDMGDPQVLKQFIDYGLTHFPAEHVMLVIWDHGQGFRGVSYDYASRSHMSINGIREALNGIHVDILIFDACLMGMLEVAYEFRDLADYIVFSEEELPTDGLPYDELLYFITTSPSISPLTYANKLVDLYINSYNGGSQGYYSYVTLSAIQTSELGQLCEELNELTLLLCSDDNYSVYATYARFAADHPETQSTFIDLGDFLTQLQNLSGGFPLLLSQINKTLASLQQVILSEGSLDDHPLMTGLTFYFPDITGSYTVPASYTALAFTKDFEWGQFLQDCLNEDWQDQDSPVIHFYSLKPKQITDLTPVQVVFSASDDLGVTSPQVAYRFGANPFQYLHAELVNGTLRNGIFTASIPALGTEAIDKKLEIICLIRDIVGNTDLLEMEMYVSRDNRTASGFPIDLSILGLGMIVAIPFLFIVMYVISRKITKNING
ncbi:MAG: clostripain-related cysteine peptidase [Promethearchaeota archaeon]